MSTFKAIIVPTSCKLLRACNITMAEKQVVEDFIALVQKCRKTKDLQCAKQVHSQICKNEMELHPVVGNYIVPMFVECGSMLDAHEVFDRLIHRNAFAWTYLILGYIHCEQPSCALELYCRMKEERVQPSSYTLVALLKACARLEDIEKGREIHGETIQRGFETNLLVGNTLVDMYSKCSAPFEAQKAFDALTEHDTVLWNVLVSGYVNHRLDHEALKCFEQMQLEVISPNATTYVCWLKACGNILDILRGQELHMYITQKGFDLDPFVGNTVIDMYAKCGSLLEARQVFNKLLVQNVVSWSALIDGYAEHQEDQEALKLYELMKTDNVHPNVVTLASILKACANLSSLDEGQEIHTDITQRGHDEDICIGNSLIDMYVKCCALLEAQKVFNKLDLRNLVSWNTIIAGFAEYGQATDAVKCLDQMQEEGICPDIVTYISALKACTNVKDVEKIRCVHSEITEKGVEIEGLIGSALVDGYAKCGSLSEAQQVFGKLIDQNVVVWNALISGYAEHGLGNECLDCFARMQSKNVCASAVTFVCILKECGNKGLLEEGRKLHGNIIRNGCDMDSYVGNTLVDIYARCGSLLDARKVFEKLCVQDIVSWNALVTGYAEHGPDHEALECFECMQKRGVCVDGITLVSVLKACGNIGAIDSVKDVHMKILYKGYENDVFLIGTLIVVYAKCGALPEATDLFNKMAHRSVVLWNAMITGYGLNHEAGMATKVFEAMREKGIKPDEVTFLCLFTACSRASLIDDGQQFLKAMNDYSISQASDHFASIVDLLARSGNINDAEKFLESLPYTPSKDTWTALLNACKNHIQGGAGTRCFQQLRKIKPDCASCYMLVSLLYSNEGVDARWEYSISKNHRKPIALWGSSSSWVEKQHDVEVKLQKHEKQTSFMNEVPLPPMLISKRALNTSACHSLCLSTRESNFHGPSSEGPLFSNIGSICLYTYLLFHNACFVVNFNAFHTLMLVA